MTNNTASGDGLASDSSAASTRPTVPELERILGIQFRVLDQGFVRVTDYMGSDSAIVQAARVSYGEGTKKIHEDRGLIRYLMRHAHTTPFEMCELKLHVRVPMDTWRQWIRHRTASINEYSTRYSVAIDAAQSTEPSAWRLQSASNKQGSDGRLSEAEGRLLSDAERALHATSRKVYEDRLAAGVAREQARKDLPLSTYTEAYWKVDLHNLLRFLELRMDKHAQQEIREYATVIGNRIVAAWCPLAWEAFQEYRLQSMHLSQLEVSLMGLIATGRKEEALTTAQQSGLIQYQNGVLKPSRERVELEEKLARLGIPAPW